MISNHLKFINQAHQIASKNLGKTFPNPSVGCLICKNNHEFEGWFRTSEDYEFQLKKNLISCPNCNNNRPNKEKY